MRNIFIYFVVLMIVAHSAKADALADAKAGLAALNRGDNAEAVRLFTNALKGDLAPADLELAHVRRAQAYLGENRKDLALTDIDRALELDSNDKEALVLREQAKMEGDMHSSTITSQASPPRSHARNCQQSAIGEQAWDDRYVINSGEVYDRRTDLTWQRCPVGKRYVEGIGCVGMAARLGWDQAMARANGSWRLPTEDELQTLEAAGCNPQINRDAFPDDDRVPVFWASVGKIVVIGSSFIHYSYYDYYGDGGGLPSLLLVRNGQ